MPSSNSIYNEATGKWEFPEKEKKASGAETAYDPTIARLPVKRDVIDQICSVVGFEPDGKDAKGRNMQKATFATKFIEKAIQHELELQKGEKALVTPDMVKQPKPEKK